MKKSIILITTLLLLPIPTTAIENTHNTPPHTCQLKPANEETGEYSEQQLQTIASQTTVRV
ncbi:hypothetical protein, partial [Nodularia sphaerocarpa]